MLYRGSYALAHMSQVLGRDEKAAEIAGRPNGEAYAFMLTEEAWRERRDTGRGGLPYRFLVSSPRSPALAWTAFFTREDMQAFLDAYGCRLDREPEPGKPFRILFPAGPEAFQPIRDDGAPYEGGKPHPSHAAMYRKID